MRKYDIELKRIKKRYDKQLKDLYITDKDTVLAYIWFKRIHKTNITKERKLQVVKTAQQELNLENLSYNKLISYLIEKREKVKDILQEFKTDIVNQLVEKGTRVNHVTRYSPKNLNYVIKPNLAETMYNERIGNFLFASIEDISKLRYAVRTSTGGMFRIGENMVIFPTNKDLKICDGRLLLNNAVYVYSLDVKYFEPVVTIRIDTHGKGKQPTIVFDDEWVSTEPIYVTDEVCEKIEDVTELLDYFKVFVFNNNKREENSQVALRLVSKPQRDVKTFLTKSMKEGKISFVNALIKESRLQEELSNK